MQKMSGSLRSFQINCTFDVQEIERGSALTGISDESVVDLCVVTHDDEEGIEFTLVDRHSWQPARQVDS